MFRRLLPLLAACWAGLALAGPALGAAPVFPKGARIGLVPPAGFTLSNKFAGFEDAARHAAITILDLPEAAYRAFEKSAQSDNPKGLTVEKREDFKFEDGSGLLITGHEKVADKPVRSWYLLANTATKPVGKIALLVSVRVPEAASAAYTDKTVRAALKTVSFRVPPTDELLGLLPFKLNELADFRVLKVTPPAGVVLIDGKSDDLLKNPHLVVTIGRGAPNDAESRPRFARTMLTTVPLSEFTVTSADAMRINGDAGYEIRGQAKGPTGAPVTVVQWLRFGGGDGFLRVLGIVAKDRWDTLFPRFRAVRDGIAVR